MGFDRCDKDAAHLHCSRTNEQLLLAFGAILPWTESFTRKNECKPFAIFESADDVEHGFDLTPDP